MIRSMKMIMILPIVCVLLFSASGCSTERVASKDEFGVYYINNAQTTILKLPYQLKGSTTAEKILELKGLLSKNNKNSENKCAIPAGVNIVSYDLEERMLSLHFNRAYSELKGSREALLRAAVVKTYLQLDEVDSVSFFIADDALLDLSGNVIGAMTDESFLLNFGAEEEAPESGTFVLYYSSVDGKHLVKKQRAVYYNNNLMPEEVVLKNLSRYPDSDDGARPALAPGTKILSVTTSDGICYVDLDSSFLNQSNNVSMEVAVYAIVNSLSSLENVNKVQIIVNDEDDGSPKSNGMVSGLYEADYSLVKK